MDQLILLTSDLDEIGPCRYNADFDTGDPDQSSCDFQVEGTIPDTVGAVYVPGTEFGGFLEYDYGKSGRSVIGDSNYKRGFTWHGLLTQWVICPPSGFDYYIANGDGNAVLRALLANTLGGFFYVPTYSSGVTISNYKFSLYCTVLEGLIAMCVANSAKLVIHADKISAGQPIRVTAEIKPAAVISGVYNGDSPVPLIFTSSKMGINHLICMGRGELQERERVDLYINNRGQVSQTRYYTGLAERQAYYNYSAAQSTDDLIAKGTKRLKEIASSNALQIGKSDISADVGDIIKGTKGRVTVQAPVSRKILRISGGIFNIECKVKGEL